MIKKFNLILILFFLIPLKSHAFSKQNEQKIKEEQLIQKFYSDQSSNNHSIENNNSEQEQNINEENKNN